MSVRVIEFIMILWKCLCSQTLLSTFGIKYGKYSDFTDRLFFNIEMNLCSAHEVCCIFPPCNYLHLSHCFTRHRHIDYFVTGSCTLHGMWVCESCIICTMKFEVIGSCTLHGMWVCESCIICTMKFEHMRWGWGRIILVQSTLVENVVIQTRILLVTWCFWKWHAVILYYVMDSVSYCGP